MGHQIYVYSIGFKRGNNLVPLGDLTGEPPKVTAAALITGALESIPEDGLQDDGVKRIVRDPEIQPSEKTAGTELLVRAVLSVGLTADSSERHHRRTGQSQFTKEPVHTSKPGDGNFVDSYVVGKLPAGAMTGYIAMHVDGAHRYKSLLLSAIQAAADPHGLTVQMRDALPHEAVAQMLKPSVQKLVLRRWVPRDAIGSIGSELTPDVQRVRVETVLKAPRLSLGGKKLARWLAKHDGTISVDGIDYSEVLVEVKRGDDTFRFTAGEGSVKQKAYDVTDDVKELANADGELDKDQMFKLCSKILEVSANSG